MDVFLNAISSIALQWKYGANISLSFLDFVFYPGCLTLVVIRMYDSSFLCFKFVNGFVVYVRGRYYCMYA